MPYSEAESGAESDWPQCQLREVGAMSEEAEGTDSSAAAESIENARAHEEATTGSPESYLPANSGNRAVWVAAVLLFLVVLTLLVAIHGGLRHWFALHTGIIHGGPDVYYNFWSGFGSDLGEATLISAVGVGVYTGVRRVNCHTKGCWRIGHHPLEGTPYILCKHHHPGVPSHGASHEEILAAHERSKAHRSTPAS
jgi:hypothetical protein